MDNYEWNRLAGWVLAAAVSILGLSIITGMVYAPTIPATKGYKVEGVVEESAEGAGPAVEAEQPIAVFLASADLARGEAQFKKCAACHTIDQGGANGIGPNLHGIIGAQVAARPGFGYSDALKGHGGQWDWEAMNKWLQNPRGYVPGNKMSFAGLSKPQDRADVLAYLNSKSGSPMALPAVPAAEPAAATDVPETAPAAAEAAGAGEAPASDGEAPATEGTDTPADAAQAKGE